MAEYRDLIGIMALAKDLVRRMPSSYYNGIVKLLWEIKNLPAADVAPVIRCKDCKHGTRLVCDLAGNKGIECHYGNIARRLDWFCADGAKMDGGTE